MGNKIGWLLAVLLVAAIATFITLKLAFPGHTELTSPELKNDLLKLLEPKGPFTEFVPMPTGPGNAGDSYFAATRLLPDGDRDAMDAYIKEVEDIVIDWKKDLPAADDRTLKNMQDMAAFVHTGAQCAKMEYCGVHTPKELKVVWIFRPGTQINTVGRLMQLLALYYISQKDYTSAEKVMQDTFIMGWHCQQERVSTWMSHVVAIETEIRALEILRDVNTLIGRADTKLRGQCENKVKAISEYINELQLIQGYNGVKIQLLQKVEMNPADLYRIAKDDEDRAWRVHAILMLGRLRYSAVERGDISYTDSLIEEYMQDSDVWIKAAAKAAHDMTSEENKRYATTE